MLPNMDPPALIPRFFEQVAADAALGPAPSMLVTNISLDGGTLQYTGATASTNRASPPARLS